ncbi:MAG: class III signal peptide-containing protein [Oligoflexia bacterium]|nr:class III signal peptide-containing protein [Oligoflexia bacterium]
MKSIRRFLNRRGQSATEYILILAVIVVIILAVGRVFKDKMKKFASDALDKVSGGIEKVDSVSDDMQ